MKLKQQLITLTAALLTLGLVACSETVPVHGSFEDGSASIGGTATGHTDGSGTMDLTTSTGLKLKGTFVYTTKRTGEGTFVCSDGRSGSFSFVSTGMKGTGTGRLGSQLVTFTFGS